MISSIIITILILLLLTISYMLFLALKRINQYEDLIINITNIVEFISDKVKVIDNSGHFEADDEVGFFFKELKELGKILNNLFEEEVDDATIKEEKKKEE